MWGSLTFCIALSPSEVHHIQQEIHYICVQLKFETAQSWRFEQCKSNCNLLSAFLILLKFQSCIFQTLIENEFRGFSGPIEADLFEAVSKVKSPLDSWNTGLHPFFLLSFIFCMKNEIISRLWFHTAKLCAIKISFWKGAAIMNRYILLDKKVLNLEQSQSKEK